MVCLVLPVLQDVSEEEWKTCAFMAWLINLGSREILVAASNKKKREREKRKICVMKECFPVLFKRKTLSFVKVMFSVLTGIQFPLTIFLYCCQTWENKESEFQEFTFLQSNTALNFLFF